jgi:hypothetical protein
MTDAVSEKQIATKTNNSRLVNILTTIIQMLLSMCVRMLVGKQETYLLLSVSIRYQVSYVDCYFQLKLRRCIQGLSANIVEFLEAHFLSTKLNLSLYI